LFAQQYTRDLNSLLENNYGKELTNKLRSKQGVHFSEILKKHIKKSNIFRRELPHLFKADGSDKSKRKIVEEKL
jgi:hypothetical protein